MRSSGPPRGHRASGGRRGQRRHRRRNRRDRRSADAAADPHSRRRHRAAGPRGPPRRSAQQPQNRHTHPVARATDDDPRARQRPAHGARQRLPRRRLRPPAHGGDGRPRFPRRARRRRDRRSGPSDFSHERSRPRDCAPDCGEHRSPRPCGAARLSSHLRCGGTPPRDPTVRRSIRALRRRGRHGCHRRRDPD